MACTKWEEIGLLYTSGELDEKDKGEYQLHLSECKTCRDEIELYFDDRKNLYTHEILGEAPSSKVNEEILRVCGQGKVKPVGFNLMSLFLKRSVAAVFFLCIGLGGGLYLSFNMQGAAVNSVAGHQDGSITESGSSSSMASLDDSLDTDSANYSKPFDKRQSDMAAENAVTVSEQQ